MSRRSHRGAAASGSGTAARRGLGRRGVPSFAEPAGTPAGRSDTGVPLDLGSAAWRLLPTQVDARAATSPERALAAAVVELALRDLRSPARAADAWTWLQDEAPTDWAYAFENLCEALGIDAARVRHALLAWRERRQGDGAVLPDDAVEAVAGGGVPTADAADLGARGAA
jgi:hypothetical protein